MINNLKDLKALVKLCRSQGITTIKVEGAELTLGDLPKAPKAAQPEMDIPEANIVMPQYKPQMSEKVKAFVDETIKTDDLTEEQLLFYSSATEPGLNEKEGVN